MCGRQICVYARTHTPIPSVVSCDNHQSFSVGAFKTHPKIYLDYFSLCVTVFILPQRLFELWFEVFFVSSHTCFYASVCLHYVCLSKALCCSTCLLMKRYMNEISMKPQLHHSKHPFKMPHIKDLVQKSEFKGLRGLNISVLL